MGPVSPESLVAMSAIARHYQWRWRWCSVVVAAVGFAGVAMIAVTTRVGLGPALVFAGLPMLVTLGAVSQFSHLEFNPNSVAVVGCRRRAFDLNGLRSIEYRRSGRTASCILNGIDGKLKLSMTTYDHDDEWKPMILEKADRLHASVDDRARSSLSHADGTGRGWLA